MANSTQLGQADVPAARRIKLTEADMGPPDVILYSDDNVEFPSHKSQLIAACDAFAGMFDAVAGGEDAEVPRIPLLIDSTTAEMILPLAYRSSAVSLRTRKYKELVKGIRFAHRLGMPMVVGEPCFLYLQSVWHSADGTSRHHQFLP